MRHITFGTVAVAFAAWTAPTLGAIEAKLTADHTYMPDNGGTTTVRMWVRDTGGPGIAAVAVDILAEPWGLVPAFTGEVPVTFMPPFNTAVSLPPHFGTHVQDPVSYWGSGPQVVFVKEIATSVPLLPAVYEVGTAGWAEVFHFTVSGYGDGFVYLSLRNRDISGYRGINNWESETGNPADYTGVEVWVGVPEPAALLLLGPLALPALRHRRR